MRRVARGRESPRRVGEVLLIKPPSRRRTASAEMALKSSADAWPAVANAHAVLESSCGLKLPICRRTTSAEMALKSSADAWPALANAHAVLAKCCGSKSTNKRRAAPGSARHTLSQGPDPPTSPANA